jgi:hypothetical protein
VRAEDGTYWLVDEYRPAIYHFTATARWLARYVPEGSNNEETGVAVGEEALPAIYAQRRANRGFEAVALRDGILYAFIQSPIDNPDGGKDSASKASTIWCASWPSTPTPGKPWASTSTGSTAAMWTDRRRRRDARRLAVLVLERDDDAPAPRRASASIASTSTPPPTSWATTCPLGVELQERRRPGEARHYAGAKTLVVDLGAIGYDLVDKPEGLALIDENTLAVINDNDFGVGGASTRRPG